MKRHRWMYAGLLGSLLGCRSSEPEPSPAVAAALSALEGKDDAAAARHIESLPPSGETAPVWRQIGNLRWKRKDYAESRVAFTRALEAARAAKDFPAAAGDAYRIAQTHHRETQFVEALEMVERALQWADEGQSLKRRRSSLFLTFSILYDLGDLAAAEHVLEELSSMIDSDEDALVPYLENNRGLLFMEQGRHRLAARAFERAAKKATVFSIKRAAQVNQVDMLLSLGDVEAAGQLLSQLLKAEAERPHPGTRYVAARWDLMEGRFAAAAKRLKALLETEKSPEWTQRIQVRLGRAYEGMKDPDSARAAYRAAIVVHEDLRGQLRVDDFKATAIEIRRRPYEALFELAARSKASDMALETLEAVKGRVFVEALAGALDAETSSTALMGRARARAERLLDLMPRLSRSLARAPLGAAALRARLPDVNALLYLRSDCATWGLVYQRGQVRPFLVSAELEPLDRLIEAFEARPGDAAVAASLGRMLLPKEGLPESGPLYIVPDQALGRIPFAALRVGDQRWLDRYQIAYVPSLSGLSFARQIAQDTPRSAPVVLGFGEDLEGARQEANEIAKVLGVTPWLGPEASFERLETAANAVHLHVAAHASRGIFRPWLQLADGPVYPNDILRIRLRPQTVVLASCASAHRRGSGVWGSLGAAFLAAGSQHVVAALWSVEDGPTRQFIEAFYRFGGRSEPLQALTRTQRALSKTLDPSVWAAFVYMGTGPREESESH